MVTAACATGFIRGDFTDGVTSCCTRAGHGVTSWVRDGVLAEFWASGIQDGG
jgi:hypothetical protein